MFQQDTVAKKATLIHVAWCRCPNTKLWKKI